MKRTEDQWWDYYFGLAYGAPPSAYGRHIPRKEVRRLTREAWGLKPPHKEP